MKPFLKETEESLCPIAGSETKVAVPCLPPLRQSSIRHPWLGVSTICSFSCRPQMTCTTGAYV